MSSGTDEESDMADNMSMIPYDTHRDIVLQHADSVVYFDPESRQLILRNRTRSIDNQSPTRNRCPTCGRSFHPEVGSAGQSTSSVPEEQPSFINHDYFRMLARSLPGSTESSAPSSPRRRTIQPARSGLSSTQIAPPPDAEFVGSAPAPPSATHGISETAFAPQYFEKFFVIEKELGKGGRGVVLLVRHVLDGVSLGHFACKRVPIGDDHSWLEKVLVEVQALQALSHQNLVSYRHVWLEDYHLTNFGPSVPCAFILQQYCNGGDLHNYVCGSAKVQLTTQDLKDRIRRRSRGEAEVPQKLNEPKKLSLDEIYPFFRDITAGIRFLHLNGFIHRDLKPSNCLLHSVGGETRVLVSDFGEVQYENATRKSTGATGTISYCAPEVLRRETPDGPLGNFSFKSDIFSLGMILYFLCFADLPYRHAVVLHEEREDPNQLRAEIMSWAGFDEHRKLRPELPAQLYTFLKRLLALSPEDRPTADDVNHGIRLGGLDKLGEDRRRKSLSPEELTPGRRIQKIDTPTRGNSPRRSGNRDLSLNQSHTHGHNAYGLNSTRLKPNHSSGLRHRSIARKDSEISIDNQQEDVFADFTTDQEYGEYDNDQDMSSRNSFADFPQSDSPSRMTNDQPLSTTSNILQQTVALVPKNMTSALSSPTRLRSRAQSQSQSKTQQPQSRPNTAQRQPLMTTETAASGEDDDDETESKSLVKSLTYQHEHNNNHEEQQQRQEQRYLLPPPSSLSIYNTIKTRIILFLTKDISTQSILRISILALKLFTLLQPCISLHQATNPSVLYPLLGFALLEPLVYPFQTWKALLGMVVHCSVVGWAWRVERLCFASSLSASSSGVAAGHSHHPSHLHGGGGGLASWS